MQMLISPLQPPHRALPLLLLRLPLPPRHPLRLLYCWCCWQQLGKPPMLRQAEHFLL
jgi:hypothetical protein